MPRALTSSLGLSLLLTACVNPMPAPIEQPLPPPTPDEVADLSVVSDSRLAHWLSLRNSVVKMSGEQVKAVLESMRRPESVDNLFYFGLLHQQSKTNNGWMQARDVFRLLSGDEALPEQLRQLAGILEAYNQNRINAHQHNARLQQQIDELEQQRQLLEQQIQAITEVEAAMSTRKEQ